MMQPANHRKGDDLPSIDGLSLAWFGGVLIEREVGPGTVIVLELLPEDLLDSHRAHSTNEVRAIDLVSVPDEALRRCIVGKGVDQIAALSTVRTDPR
jgi:hypothetical protein